MTLPRNYEKELSEAFQLFRAKCTELNLVNSEMLAAEEERKKHAAALDKARDKYNHYLEAEYQPIASKLTEIRSELQAMQASMLDSVIEFMIRGHND